MQANSTFHNADIICFSLSRWDSPISSPAVSLAREFAKSHRVFFIQHPYSYKDFLLDTRPRLNPDRGVSGSIKLITPPLTYPINFLPEGKLYDFFSRLNNRILVRTLRKTIVENNISEYIFINFFDPFFFQKIPDDIRPLKYIYQCMDDVSQVDYTSRHGVRLEHALIANADYTLCTSHELTRLKSHLSPHVFFYPNGADTELFNKAYYEQFKRPSDLHFPDKKIVGFTGSIEYRMDFDLLKAVSQHHSDKIIYMIGPVYGDEHIKSGLAGMPNVVFAGPRNISELPAYLQYFDCTIIPYKKNTLTRSIYPLKINEYLAAGKPVVATDFSEDICSFHETAYIAGTHKEFNNAIDVAIAQDNTEARQQRLHAAFLNSWSKRVEQFWSIISPM